MRNIIATKPVPHGTIGNTPVLNRDGWKARSGLHRRTGPGALVCAGLKLAASNVSFARLVEKEVPVTVGPDPKGERL